MPSSRPLGAHELLARIGGRPLYLWGAGQTGIGTLRALSRLDVTPAGFIDKREALQGTRVAGLPVLAPATALQAGEAGCRPFVIDTTFGFKDENFERCAAAGLRHGEDFLSYEEICPLDYQIIVSGICNLRCISCPLGNMEVRPSGYMSARTYERVLDKILAETPLVGIVQLYGWGEPLLNRDLPEIIRLTNARDVLCAVSSNLSLRKDFEDVIRARPGCFRVSVSGIDEAYELTHTGGSWSRVRENMYRLRDWRAAYCPEMPVEVTYHLYSDNTGEPHDRVEALCGELGFVFRAHMAALLPLDNVEAHALGLGVGAEAKATIDKLLLPIDDALALAREQRHLDCSFEHAINIEYDLTVRHCGLFYGTTDNHVADSYLDTPLEQLLAIRSGSRLCGRCKQAGLHRFCRIYTDSRSAAEVRRLVRAAW